MPAKNPTRNLHGPSIVLGVLLLGVALASIAPAQSGVEDTNDSPSRTPGEVLWPGENATRFQDLPELAQRILTVQDPLVLGPTPFQTLTVDRLNQTRSRLTIQAADGTNHTVLQRHEPQNTTGHQVLNVPPEHLPPTILLAAPTSPGESPDAQDILQIVAPPGSFNVTGETELEKAEDLARRMGIAPVTVEDQRNMTSSEHLETQWRSPGHPPLWPFHTRNGCITTPEDPCNGEAMLKVACEDCVHFERALLPQPGMELEEKTNMTVVAFSNDVRVIFDKPWTQQEEAHVIAVQFDLAFDLDEERVLDPDLAAQEVIIQLEAQGYQVAQEIGKGPTSHVVHDARALTSAGVVFTLDGETLHPTEVSYLWDVNGHDTHETLERHQKGEGFHHFRVFQDAQTGVVTEIISRNRTSQEGGPREAGDPGGQSQATPVPGVLAVLVAVAGASLAVRRGRG